MSDFAIVRRSAADSWLGQQAGRLSTMLAAAWRTSAVGAVVIGSVERLNRTTVADRIRWTGGTIAIAALVHLALRSLLSSTVMPALPTVLIAGVAAFAALIAWQATAFERAWRER